ncbi:MAG: LysM peptidoglycan-binding domain-containing protein [Verrucomicrobiales bacterium]
MKYLLLLPLGLALLTTSCANKKTGSKNPSQSNPYYGPSSGSTYSSTSSTASYPSYSENTYTPPTSSASASSLPSVPSVPSPPASNASTSTSIASNTYTTPYSAGSESGSSTHTVVGGENLYRISLKHGTSVAAIKSANGMSGDTIHPGQTLRIP